jgi:acyl transferase domain-containing protein
VKANFGHLDRAAGVAGLIKTVLALENGAIPPSILFDEPNPQIDFAGSPFFVNTALREWKPNGAPRLAAVNSLGMGGTNAHVILEEAPQSSQTSPSEPSRPWQLLVLSAKSPEALDQAARNLADHFESHPEVGFADAAYTLQVGRRGLEHRRTLVCRDAADAVSVLRAGDPRRVFTTWREEGERPVVFLFSGLGGQSVNMGRGLYDTEPTFRAAVDRCAQELEPLLGRDLRTVLYPPSPPSTCAACCGAEEKGLATKQPGNSTRPASRSRPSSLSNTRSPNCGWSGASAPPRSPATAWASTWRPASPASFRSPTPWRWSPSARACCSRARKWPKVEDKMTG